MPLYNENWSTVWPETGKRRGDGKRNPSRYAPTLTLQEIHDIEMTTVNDPRVGIELLSDRSHLRCFYRDVGYIVGASMCKLTSWVFVRCEVVSAGELVFGFPITVEELRKKGAVVT
jgi:hypothetical protein